MDLAGGPAWLPPDLERLRTVETLLSVLLDETRVRIAAVEAEERVRADAARHRPPVVEWVIEYGIDAAGRSILVHTGDCPLVSGRSRPATRAQAVEALRDSMAHACAICRVDSALGLLDV
ncbi:DUF6233 domain-containing protein [Streptomyces sp. NPDC001553]|uniref:DUF6233 domain-containing protein n=1 Tax=Streptomyces sp. NPDC001553 TaxID=3154385 RepID=UPI003318E692